MSRKQQSYFNFTRGNKLHILREIAPLMPHSRMTRVLRAIDERHWQFARDQPAVTLSHRQIASYDGMSVPTARRGITDLMEHNLLIKKEIVTSYGQQANSYQIVWSNLDAIVNDGEPLTEPAPVPVGFSAHNSQTPAPVLDEELTQVLKEGGDHSDHPPDHDDQPPAHSDQPPPDHHDQASLYPGININPPPPSETSSWEEVEEILISEFKVGRPVPAVTAAREAGCSTEEILQLFQFARSKPGAYGPGAIYTRIREARPGRDPTSGWPNESEDYLRREKKSQTRAKADQTAQAAAERGKRREQEQRTRQLLERDYGPELDQMNRDELLDFAKAHCNEMTFKMLIRKPDVHRGPGWFRDVLLKALKARQSECLVNSTSADVEGSAFGE